MADCFLHMVVGRQNVKSIKFELEHGANVNATGMFNSTALHIACRDGCRQIVKLLLGHNADVNVKDKDGLTPLHIALKEKKYNVAKLLLSTKVDVNATTNSMSTPLHFAVKFHDESDKDSGELVDSLLRLGAEIDARDENGRTAIHLAVRYRNNYAVEVFLDKNPDVRDENNRIAFLEALTSSHGNPDLVSIFVNRGFMLKSQDFVSLHMPKFIYARFKKSLRHDKISAIIQDLLKREATPQAFMEYKVLKACVSNGFYKILRHVCRPDMNVNALLDDGCTLLHIACRKSEDAAVYKNVIEELLKCGADVNAVDFLKNTPLHLSARYQNKEIVSVLLKHGADLEARDADSETPLFVALRRNHSNVQVLLDAGADVNSVGKNGLRPLHVATRKRCEYCVNLLLYYDADMNVENDENESPLDLADEVRDRKIVEILLDNGAAVKKPKGYFNACKIVIKEHKIKIAEINNSGASGKDTGFCIKCREEIKKMKCEKIGYNVSLYDVLTKGDNDVARYARNENMIRILNAGKYNKRFPIFANMLKIRVLKAEKKNRLINLSAFCLVTIVKKKIPELVTREIFSYVDNVDLRNLIHAAPIDKDKKASVRCDYLGEKDWLCSVDCNYDSDSENYVDSDSKYYSSEFFQSSNIKLDYDHYSSESNQDLFECDPSFDNSDYDSNPEKNSDDPESCQSDNDSDFDMID